MYEGNKKKKETMLRSGDPVGHRILQHGLGIFESSVFRPPLSSSCSHCIAPGGPCSPLARARARARLMSKHNSSSAGVSLPLTRHETRFVGHNGEMLTMCTAVFVLTSHSKLEACSHTCAGV